MTTDSLPVRGAADRALAERAVAEPAAREAIYRAHAPGIARRLRALLVEPKSVEDLVHDVFVTAFERLPSYDGRVALEHWLHGVTVNVARNHRRKQRRRRGLWARFLAPDAPHPDTPEERFEGRELIGRLYAALEELSDAKREAFVLRVIDRCSLEQAAEILGTTPKTISERAKAAERHVRRRLEAER